MSWRWAALLVVVCSAMMWSTALIFNAKMSHVDTEVPAWVMRGILMHESSSRYDENGAIVYVNRKRSKAGAAGPFQVMPATFKLYAIEGERFEWLETDLGFAEDFAKRMLMQIYEDERSWTRALSVYNTGRVCSRGNIYAEEILKKGRP